MIVTDESLLVEFRRDERRFLANFKLSNLVGVSFLNEHPIFLGAFSVRETRPLANVVPVGFRRHDTLQFRVLFIQLFRHFFVTLVILDVLWSR